MPGAARLDVRHRAIAKTSRRIRSYLSAAITCREPERDQVLVVWGFLAGAAWLVLALAKGDAVAGAWLFGPLLLSVLLGICAIDSRYGIIPDSLVAALSLAGAVGLLAAGSDADWRTRLIAATLVYGFGRLAHALYRRLRGYDGFGLGDVKLMAASCLWIDGTAMAPLVLVAVLSALASLAILRFGRRLALTDAIPFGPHLAVALWIVWLASPHDGLAFLLS